MKNLLILIALFLVSCQQKQPEQITTLSQPIDITAEGLDFHGAEHLLLVPENRSNPESRLIALHIFRFPAKQKSGLPPVVFLGAGPGEPYDEEHFYEYYHGDRAKAWTWELSFLNEKRDVLLINQRGNPDTPGFPLREFEYRWRNGSREEPFDFTFRNRNRQTAYRERIDYFQEKGVDLAGYDIINLVEDVETVRRHFDYEELAFVGNSFGSQWGLAYMRSYPQHCDRALFSGVEPLDHTYDDPQGIWQVLERVATAAEADPQLAPQLPEVGLMEAFKTVIRRLEEEPAVVQLQIPAEDIDEIIPLGPDDLRMNYLNPYADGRIEALESWPKYITELYHGDYRTLALRSRGRASNSSSLLMATLIDNSLDISAAREAQLDQREAARWLGDINLHYKMTREVSPTSEVSDAFREARAHDIPVLLIHGDLDRNTPLANARELMSQLENGHLITVRRGTHTAKRALILRDSALATDIYEFMNLDLDDTDFQSFRSTLPTEYELPPLQFWPIKGESLYEKVLRE